MCQPGSLGINAKTGIELTLPVELSPLATEGRRRRKLWGIPKRLHYPVIGTCLNVQELRRLASKVDPAGNWTANDYELHVNFVCAAETKNALFYEVHKELAIQKKCRQRHPLAAEPLPPQRERLCREKERIRASAPWEGRRAGTRRRPCCVPWLVAPDSCRRSV